jgi:hypothetical protein
MQAGDGDYYLLLPGNASTHPRTLQLHFTHIHDSKCSVGANNGTKVLMLEHQYKYKEFFGVSNTGLGSA